MKVIFICNHKKYTFYRTVLLRNELIDQHDSQSFGEYAAKAFKTYRLSE